MTPSSRSRHKRTHKKRNLIGRFLDRLIGKKHRRSSKSGSFPGISDIPGSEKEDHLTKDTGAQPAPEIVKESRKYKTHGKGSFTERLELRSKKRALKREEKKKNRIKKKIRKQHQKRYKKEELGRTLPQRLMTVTPDGEQDSGKKKISIFSKRSAFYKNSSYIVNSTIIFILTYIVVYLVYWLTELLTASLFGFDSILYYYDLKFNDYSALWTRFNILVITGVPPFLCLAIGLLLHRRIFQLKRFSGLQKLFILWWSLHSLNHFFGAFASGIVTSEGFGYVAAWMYLNTALKFLFSLISLFLLAVIGYYSRKHFLETSFSLNRIKRENQVSFLFTQALIPWIVGSFLILIIRIPHNFDYPYETLLLFSVGFAIIPAFFNSKVKPKLNMLKVKKHVHINATNIIMVLVLLAFYRILLGIGLHFINRISISISPAI